MTRICASPANLGRNDFLARPMPCSRVMVPPRRMASSKISLKASSTRCISSLLLLARGSVRYGPSLPQNADANGVGAQRDGTELGGDSPAPLAILLSLIGKIGGTTNAGTGTLLPEGMPGRGAGFVGAAYSQVVSNGGRLFFG